MTTNNIQSSIEKIYASTDPYSNNIQSLLNDFVAGLNCGQIRAATPTPNGTWHTNQWVKQGVLLLFRYGKLCEMPIGNQSFLDKNTLKLRQFQLDDEVRIVPGGAFVRDGAYLGKGVICMSPSYINIGVFIGEGSLVDSNALVGTCAQIGQHVHISAGAQIGGVLEPIGANPVIIEDNALIGGNCGIYEGVIVKQNAVLGSGVILNSSTKVYDIVNECLIESCTTKPLTIPENAVLVPGCRSVNSEFGKQHGLSISTVLIVKYRDNKTNEKTQIEQNIRK